MELWILATFAAALFQTLRFILHKKLSLGGLGPTGSTFARFAYAAPFAALVMGGYVLTTAATLPSLNVAFWAWAWSGAVGQILATICVVALFAKRNFAVGITFKKTEVIQTAIVGLLVLGEVVSAAGWAAIAVGLVGVLLLSETPGSAGTLWRRLGTRAVALGLASGFFFAISAVGYRAASLELATDDALLRAGVTLVCVTASQALGMGIYLAVRAPAQLAATWSARRVAVWLGLSSMAGSLSWFTAFTLQTAALVQALGQVELIFSLAASVLVFRERITRRELGGIALLTLSILILIAVV